MVGSTTQDSAEVETRINPSLVLSCVELTSQRDR